MASKKPSLLVGKKLKNELLHSCMPVAVMALPLINANTTTGLTGDLRLFGVLVIALLAAVYYASTIKSTVRRLPAAVSISLLLFVMVSVASSLHAGGIGAPAILVGTAEGQLGLAMWICFLIIGLSAAPVTRRALFSPLALYIVLLVGIFSLIEGRFYLVHGLRLDGLLYQPTSMAIYACLATIMAIIALSRQPASRIVRLAAWLVLLIHTAIIILTQSRLGWLCLIVIAAVNGWIFAKKQISISVFAGLVLALMLVLPLTFQSYFSRYRQSSVVHGSSYRLELYETVGKDTYKHHLILGNGTRALPADLNNRRAVPEDIAKSLDQGYVFLSSHDMFIDVAYYFGAIAALAVVVILVYGVRSFLAVHDTSIEGINYLLLFGVLLMNALVNVPSIELTPLFFLVLFGLFKSDLHGTAA